ncbi:hypothetical protein EVAR_61583_1 [Eumeta japonica]|uniref:Uncharacterized protein n=1 Tax=Eumeta variegata TaxID=151549 RepID=A0A4C1YUJ2_EUMVA|nr:hypothetical protein EVAR_61583_1 [Eumeta japonica]
MRHTRRQTRDQHLNSLILASAETEKFADNRDETGELCFYRKWVACCNPVQCSVIEGLREEPAQLPSDTSATPRRAAFDSNLI